MKERVFIRKNIFTSVMFGAVFLFVLSTMRLEFFKNLLRISRRSFCLRPLL